MKSKLAGILLALVLFAAPVAAEEVEVNGTTEIRADAGVAPDSPFYGLENALERVRLALTFNEQRRAERALDYADERLAEIREMVEEGKFEAAQRARMRYEQKLEAAAEATERVESDSSDDRAREALLPRALPTAAVSGARLGVFRMAKDRRRQAALVLPPRR